MGQFDNFLPKPGLPTTGNRAYGETVVNKKPKGKTAAAGSPPPPPPPGPKDNNNKKEPSKSDKKRPPEEGGLVRIRK